MKLRDLIWYLETTRIMYYQVVIMFCISYENKITSCHTK